VGLPSGGADSSQPPKAVIATTTATIATLDLDARDVGILTWNLAGTA